MVAAWPALALVGSYELLMALVRGQALGAPANVTAVPEPPASLNGHADRAAETFAPDLERGQVPGVRRIRRALNVGQPKATEVLGYLQTLAASNGRGGRDG